MTTEITGLSMPTQQQLIELHEGRPVIPPGYAALVVFCDLCQLRGADVLDCQEHALLHCRLGEHCISTTAACAAEESGGDHPSACEICGKKLREPLETDGLESGMNQV